MTTHHICHADTGETQRISNPLLPRDICVGLRFWYNNSSCLYGHRWSCPGEIVEVDPKARTFRVCSFDDMQIDPQVYRFELTTHRARPRETMRLVSGDVIERYLAQKEETGETYMIPP